MYHNLSSTIKHIAVVGSGSWATALVKIFSDSGIKTSWLVRDENLATRIIADGCNPRYLSTAHLKLSHVKPTAHAEEALTEPALIVFAVPAIYLTSTLDSIDPVLLENKQLAVSIKGFIPGTGCTPGTYLNKNFSCKHAVIVIGGPCHAEEIALERNTYLTIAGKDNDMANALCHSIHASYIHCIHNEDPTGVEYVSILKNIIGIATGIATGLNYGVNFQAVVVSNAMREIESFLQTVYPGKRCLHDSVYFGDMLVTAYSVFSRNRTLGKLIGRGFRINKAIQSMEMIAEGYHASRELAPIVKDLGMSLPVINSTYRILHLQANPFHEYKFIETQLR